MNCDLEKDNQKLLRRKYVANRKIAESIIYFILQAIIDLVDSLSFLISWIRADLVLQNYSSAMTFHISIDRDGVQRYVFCLFLLVYHC